MIEDAIEEIAQVRAIEEGRQTETISREEVLLNGPELAPLRRDIVTPKMFVPNISITEVAELQEQINCYQKVGQSYTLLYNLYNKFSSLENKTK